jgi:hypothetical protein
MKSGLLYQPNLVSDDKVLIRRYVSWNGFEDEKNLLPGITFVI